MSEPDHEIKKIITDFLNDSGIKWRELQRTQEKTPDFILGEDASNPILLEIKTKKDDLTAMEELNAPQNEGDIVSKSQPTNRWNTIDGVIRDGVEQMKKFDPTRKLLRIVWYHCTGFDADLAEMRLKATLYGTQNLFVMSRPNIVTCHYFWDSTFFRYKSELDGVVISRKGQAQLNLNDHSLRFEDAKRSSFTTAFGNAVYHPRQYIDDKDFMFNDSAKPRNNEMFTLSYLQKKYNLNNLQTINMQRHSAMMKIPKNFDSEGCSGGRK